MTDLTCNKCGKELVDGQYEVYDSWAEKYFCSDYCAYMWMQDNYEIVEEFYVKMNHE